MALHHIFSPADWKAARIAKPTPRVFDAPAPLRLWHLASLDAPTVAVAWAEAFARAAQASLPWWIPALLALAAWAVYVADRLLDARSAMRSGKTSDLRERHFFHWRRRRMLAPMAAAAAMAAAAMAFGRMPPAARERGAALALAATVYLSRVHFTSKAAGAAGRGSRLRIALWRIRLPKELLVSVLFTAACVLPLWNRAPERPWELAAAGMYFAALAWLNCYAIDRWEARGREVSRSGVLASAGLLSCAGCMLALCVAASRSRWAELMLAGAGAAFLLGLLDCVRKRLTSLALRSAADLVLLTPLALWLLW